MNAPLDTEHEANFGARSNPKGVFIQTFGCQMNDYDTSKMLEVLRAENYHAVNTPEQADLILINSCAIREKPENKVYSLLGRYERIKKARPDVVIGVGGCVAQQDGRRMLDRAPVLDLVFGTDNLFELPEMLRDVASGRKVVRTEWRSRKVKVQNFIPSEAMGGWHTAVPGRGIAAHERKSPHFRDEHGPVVDGPVGAQTTAPKAQIAITKGCNNFCTFCVVPYTRGLEVSREPQNIVQEAEALVERGARDITLLGQNVNSYKAKGTDFVDLLCLLNDLPGLSRIRYTSPHPKDFNRRLAQAHQSLPKLCEHLHLPFQSGSNAILKAMHRNHTIESYLKKIEMVRSLVPRMAFSTDIIVGFPGESDADFEKTLSVFAAVRFDHLYAFKFSPRSITPAASLPGQVAESVKAARLERMLNLHESILCDRNRRLVGSVQEVLVEGWHPRHPGEIIGRTRGNKSTAVVNCEAAPGDLVPVEIIATRKFSLVGKVANHGATPRLH